MLGSWSKGLRKCHFVGVDHELKGFCVYWLKKNRVSIKRDIYFNKNEVLAPDEVQFEGGNDLPSTLDCC